MFVEVHTPQQLTGQELDAYLQRGWFRMGQTIFTTNFAHVKDKILSTIWLRIKLHEYSGDRSYSDLLKRYAKFSVSVQPAAIDEEKETLFTRYRESLSFSVSESLQHLLFGKEATSVYTTYEVTVRDNSKLFACGFFDLGGNSAEGIVSFYDPAYKKFSPGKFVIYSKVQYCKELGLEFFYPGYFVPGNPYFDYKLNIGRKALQFLQLATGEWHDMDRFTESDVPVDAIRVKLEHMQGMLQQNSVESHLLKYEFFDAGLIPDMRNSGLLDFPLFLLIGPLTDEPAGIIVVYDCRDGAYHLLVCMPVWKPDRTNPDVSFYSSYFIKPVQEVYATGDVHIMTTIIARIVQKSISSVM
ncbi:MAG: arginyl-tRNA--protein arginylyltransferase [Cyclobacteriaceae bacterium]|nr:MAG: arginyl-tRNA--protein arginylyltransferase [Cyclobacteriaceae bacterium]